MWLVNTEDSVDAVERFLGKGVQQAVTNVIEEIAPKLVGNESTDQVYIDNYMIELDGTEYTVDQLDSFTADFNFGDMKPAFLVGWMGKGFNFLFGAAIASPELELEATGLISQIPQFQADLQAEVDQFNDDMGSIPIYPLVRLGWQFGF